MKLTSISIYKANVNIGAKKKAQLFGGTFRGKKVKERQEIEKKEQQIERENRR